MCSRVSPESVCMCISLPARVPAPVRVCILPCPLLSLFRCLLVGSERCVASALWVCLPAWCVWSSGSVLFLPPSAWWLPSSGSSPVLVLGDDLPCEFTAYSMFLCILSLMVLHRFLGGGKFFFPLYLRPFLQNNSVLT